MEGLEQENAFYEAHKNELREKYLDKWLVITGNTLYGIYDKFADAAKDALEHIEHGKIMIHRPADDNRTIQFGPRICPKYPEEAKKPVQRETITYSSGTPLKIPYAY